ncbi:MAG: TerB family tellurite resistance protein [Pseudomonadota bacterium]
MTPMTEHKKAPGAGDAATDDTAPARIGFDEDHRRAVRASCGAFLLVAFADGTFDPSEEARLLAGLVNQKPFSEFNAAILEGEYNGLVAALRSDYRAAAQTILADITWAGGAPELADAVVRAARAAIVADTRLEAQEEAAIAQICQALGREPGAI